MNKIVLNRKYVQHIISECIDRYINHVKRDYKSPSNSRIYKNESCQNTKRIIRLKKSDLVNIVNSVCLNQPNTHRC